MLKNNDLSFGVKDGPVSSASFGADANWNATPWSRPTVGIINIPLFPKLVQASEFNLLEEISVTVQRFAFESNVKLSGALNPL